jgi:hypothetical protein
MSARTLYRRRFGVEDVQVDLILDVAAADPVGVKTILDEEAASLAERLMRRLWDRRETTELATTSTSLVLGSLSKKSRRTEIEQLCDLAATKNPLASWTALQLADLAAEAGLFHAIINGHRPGQKLDRVAASQFGKMLIRSGAFKISGSGHGRRYFLNHGKHHGRHHESSDPAPFELFTKK